MLIGRWKIFWVSVQGRQNSNLLHPVFNKENILKNIHLYFLSKCFVFQSISFFLQQSVNADVDVKNILY